MKLRTKVISVLLFVFCISFLPCLHAVSPEEVEKITAAVPTKPVVTPKSPRKLLVFNRCDGFRHSAIPYGAKALEIMGPKSGAFEATQSEDMGVFSAESLAGFDAVFFNNTVGLKFTPEQQKALMDFVKGGKGIAGLHGATDNFQGWPEAIEMMGGNFAGHPWGSGGTWAVKIEDRDHPLTKAFDGKDFKVSDEIYRVNKINLRKNSRILVSLDMSDATNSGVSGLEPRDNDVPISWVRNFGEGRVFYCSFGHNHDIFWNKQILQHYLDGIQFAMGDLPADTTPVAFNPLAGRPQVLDELLSELAVYQHGQPRKGLNAIEDIIHDIAVLPEVCKEVEQKFLAFLRSNATIPAKQFICRQLSVIGSDASAGTLAAMLRNPDTVDMALYAMERIPADAIDESLRTSLRMPMFPAKTRIGIINTLGRRRDSLGVPIVAPLLYDSNTEIATAAASALGNIAGSEATKAIANAVDKTTGQCKMVVLDAYLRCADDLSANGKKSEAHSIYKQLYESDNAEIIRAAALRGMVHSAPKEPGAIIIDAIKKGAPLIQSAAFALVIEIPDSKQVKAVADELANLPAPAQVQLLAALAGRGDTIARSAVIGATESTDVEVRIAALKALAVLGSDADVALLAKVAATAAGAECDAARASLYTMHNAGVDEAILTAVGNAGPAEKAELIGAIGRRNMTSGLGVLFEAARDTDTKVRTAAFRALQVIAEPKDTAAIVDLLVKVRDAGSEAENTLSAVANKNPDRNTRAAAVLAVIGSVKDTPTRCSLLRVLGKLKDDNSLPILTESLNDKNDAVKKAAVGALAEWPSDKPMNDLLKVARKSKNDVHRVLALRGYIRMIAMDSGRPSAETIKMYTEAMALAAGDGEKKMVLTALGQTGQIESLNLVAAYLTDEALHIEAETAVVQIAGVIYGCYPEESTCALEKVIAATKNDSLRRQGQKIIAKIDELSEYVTAWQASGPYPGPDASKLMETVFAPEKPDAADVIWKIIPVGTRDDQPWLIELDKAFGGENRVAYLRTNIISPVEQKVVMEIGSDDGVKVWLNDEVVHTNNAFRGFTRAQDKVEVTLRTGSNKLMLKVTQGTGGWATAIRLRGPDGGKIEKLRATIECPKK